MRNAIPHQGKRLAQLLEEQEKTQAWLADELHVARQQISKWIHAPGWRHSTTEKIARALGISVGVFFEEMNGAQKIGGRPAPLPTAPRLTTKEAANFAQRTRSRQ
jgi:transcriptional regulator with XRE-family HTH domain